MGELFKRPIVIGLVITAVIIAIVWSYLSNRAEQKRLEEATKKATEVTIINLTNVDPVDFDQFVVDEYATAKAKALEKDKNNLLSTIVIELPATLEINSGTDRYIFSSKSDTINNYVITLDQSTQNYIRATIPKSDYVGEVAEIDTSLWKYNFVTALQLAEKNGGKEWRESNDLTSATLTLKHTEPQNYLSWLIEYNSSTNSKTFKFDATSGKLLEN